MKFKCAGGDWFWVSFQYERLHIFCFHCGIIGHSDQFCELLYDNPIDRVNFAFGPWLRANGKRSVGVSGYKWLRMAATGQGSGGLTGGHENMIVNQATMLNKEGGKVNDDNSRGMKKSRQGGGVIASGTKKSVIVKKLGDEYGENFDEVVVTDSKRRHQASTREFQNVKDGLDGGSNVTSQAVTKNLCNVGSGL
ncbi:hypothetical protein PTKIN_Ptkin01aG0274600 [Pterospermum kingtungense]